MKRKIVALLYFTLSLSAVYGEDLIHCIDGLKIEGMVVNQEGDQFRVNVKKDNCSGYIMLDRDRVLKIEYDYEKRLEKVKHDDWTGHYNLGVFCFKNGLTEKAIGQLSAIIGKKGVPDDARLYLGKALFQNGRTAEAKEILAEYCARKPDDRPAAKLLRKISSAKKGKGPKKKGSGAKSPKKTQKKSAAKNTLPEGLEAETGWKYAWGNKAEADVFMVEESGNNLLRIKFSGGKKDKISIRKAGEYDLIRARRIRFDAYNPTSVPYSLCMAIVSHPGWVYHESRQMIIKPGWNLDKTIDLMAAEFKTKASSWEYTSPITNKNDVRQLMFLIYNGKTSGTLFLDYITIEENP
mgnify:CR=1 FL=1